MGQIIITILITVLFTAQQHTNSLQNKAFILFM